MFKLARIKPPHMRFEMIFTRKKFFIFVHFLGKSSENLEYQLPKKSEKREVPSRLFWSKIRIFLNDLYLAYNFLSTDAGARQRTLTYDHQNDRRIILRRGKCGVLYNCCS